MPPPANGYDYIELGCDRSSSPTIPYSFGGVSGGGVWKVEIDSPDGSPGSEILGEITLCGVAFYEDELDTQYPYVRCHGPGSLYSVFLPDLQAWVQSQ